VWNPCFDEDETGHPRVTAFHCVGDTGLVPTVCAHAVLAERCIGEILDPPTIVSAAPLLWANANDTTRLERRDNMTRVCV
jgi:hypothetical protein|tara:strand:- start:3160 stop:3399 length:240 start_codon:yes stop_codon:yes gene_type:complete